MKIVGDDDTIIVTGSINTYSSVVLHKCFYWYGANFDVSISEGEGAFTVELKRKIELIDTAETISKIKRDLVDFKLRDIVNSETRTVRELIIAKAFSCYDFDDNPSTELSDPVGFNPLSI